MTALAESRSTKVSENQAKSGRREAQQLFWQFFALFCRDVDSFLNPGGLAVVWGA